MLLVHRLLLLKHIDAFLFHLNVNPVRLTIIVPSFDGNYLVYSTAAFEMVGIINRIAKGIKNITKLFVLFIFVFSFLKT